jgi:phosphoribosylaminoimidazole-succinocarboxamide synthase
VSTSGGVDQTDLPLPLVGRGKVRDIYDAGHARLLMVASDRISAFDVVMNEPIPGKGKVLTQATAWWLARVEDITPHHLITVDPERILADLPVLAGSEDVWARRAMLVRRTQPVPVECVVRGFLYGSAWKEYREHGTLAGEPLPGGMVEGQPLDSPIFSPATKAVVGHDENITFTEVRRLLGEEMAARLRDLSLALYGRGRELAGESDILVADTKFEFGTLADGTVMLIDEVLTPDSSRFWPADTYVPGQPQPAMDKQPVRDFLDALVRSGAWNREPPPPRLTDEVVTSTAARYRAVFKRLTGYELEEFPVHDPGARPGP